MAEDDLKHVIEESLAGLRQHFDSTLTALRGEFADMRGEVSGIRGEVSGMRGEVSGMRGEVSELHRHFDVVAEAAESRDQLLAEGIAALSERITREVTRLDDKMDRGFADTQALIRFSHNQLDQRVRVLEKK